MEVEGVSDEAPTGRLFTAGQVAGATFIGAPIAGALLLAANYRTVGDGGARRQALVWGLVATGLVLTLAVVLPDDFPRAALPIAYTVATFQVAKRLQARLLRAHQRAGGRPHSSWRAVGIGVGCMLAVLLVLLVLGFVLPE